MALKLDSCVARLKFNGVECLIDVNRDSVMQVILSADEDLHGLNILQH